MCIKTNEIKNNKFCIYNFIFHIFKILHQYNHQDKNNTKILMKKLNQYNYYL